MAVNDVYRLSVDYTLATQVTSPVSGKTAFVPKVQFYGGGVPFDVAITAPLGTQAIAASVAVTPATSSSWAVTGPLTSTEFLADLRSTTGAKTSVNSGTGSVTILASNAARKGATITNTDANVLYLDLSGGTASSTSYSVPVSSAGFYTVPFGYTGAITGIWAADGSGAALVTEFV